MTQPELPWGLKFGAVVLLMLCPVAVIGGLASGVTGLHAFGPVMQGIVILTTSK